MYPKSLKDLFNSNLISVFIKGEVSNVFMQRCRFLLPQKLNNFKELNCFNRKIISVFKNKQFFKQFLIKPVAPRTQKNSVLKVWIYHCECVFAQRIRRCQQMFTLYSKWWEEAAFKEFISKMRQNVTKRSKHLAIASTAVYNWNKNRIPLDEFKKHEKDFDYIDLLKEHTICLSCDPTQRGKDSKDSVCRCGTPTMSEKTFDKWMPFIAKTDLVVWRRLHASGSGQYEYKMFGTYSDVTAEDFLNVQIDVDYRRKWDTTAVVLQQGEVDPQDNSNGDVIYWEMLWPRLFVNRDYVFNRRYHIDEKNKRLFIVSKSTVHPKFPKYSDKYRIEDYWSCMVIRPYTDLNKPGLEFVLTYYDNPGVNIPSSVTTWVATRAMPDFLDKLRDATRKYKAYCIAEGKSKACDRYKLTKGQEGEKLDYCTIIREAKKMLIQHAKGEVTESETDPNLKENDVDNTESKV